MTSLLRMDANFLITVLRDSMMNHTQTVRLKLYFEKSLRGQQLSAMEIRQYKHAFLKICAEMDYARLDRSNTTMVLSVITMHPCIISLVQILVSILSVDYNVLWCNE